MTFVIGSPLYSHPTSNKELPTMKTNIYRSHSRRKTPWDSFEENELSNLQSFVLRKNTRSARRALYSIAKVPCKSIMTLFLDMKKQGISKEIAHEYFMPLNVYLTTARTTSGNIRVYNAKGYEEISVPCEQVFDEIYDDRFESIMTGFLKYKS